MRSRRLLPDMHLVAVVAHCRILGDGGAALMALTDRRVAENFAQLACDRRQLGKHTRPLNNWIVGISKSAKGL